jgi:hypothetical protein
MVTVIVNAIHATKDVGYEDGCDILSIANIKIYTGMLLSVPDQLEFVFSLLRTHV